MTDIEEASAERSNWLSKNLIPIFYGTLILCVAGLLIRRLFLAGRIDTFATPILRLVPLPMFGLLESLIENVGLLFSLLIWYRFARAGWLPKPGRLAYLALSITYVLAVGYLPPPHPGAGLWHYGR